MNATTWYKRNFKSGYNLVDMLREKLVSVDHLIPVGFWLMAYYERADGHYLVVNLVLTARHFVFVITGYYLLPELCFLEHWEVALALPLLPDPLWLAVVVPVSLLSMSQIHLFEIMSKMIANFIIKLFLKTLQQRIIAGKLLVLDRILETI